MFTSVSDTEVSERIWTFWSISAFTVLTDVLNELFAFRKQSEGFHNPMCDISSDNYRINREKRTLH